MKLSSFNAIVGAFSNAGVRYLVAGGLAVNAHGYLRFTKDVDLVVELLSENVQKTFLALHELGYRPTVPVSSQEFSDPVTRLRWIQEKGMQVLQFWSDQHRETPIDVFVTEPFVFEEEYGHAMIKTLYGDKPVRFVSIATLIRMKTIANRPQDQADIDQLRMLAPDDKTE